MMHRQIICAIAAREVEGKLPTYRLYFLGSNGQIYDAIDIQSADDAQAIGTVEQHFQGRAMRLTHRKRTVKIYPLDDNEDTAPAERSAPDARGHSLTLSGAGAHR